MPVSETWPVWICDLLRDYIDAAAGVDGIPTTTAVPRHIFSDGSEVTDPHLHFSAVIGKRWHEYVLPMTIDIRLTTQAVGDSATTEAAAVAWMQAIRRRMQKRVSASTSVFGEWLSALSAETRRGWQILADPTLNAEVEVDYDSDPGRRICTEQVRLSVRIEAE